MPTNAINDTGVKYLYDKLHGEIEGCINDDVETVVGNPLNFSTKFAQHAKSTKLTLEPIQDLHGYDKPWIGGAGKNLFRINEPISPKTENGITMTPVYNDDGGLEYLNFNGQASATTDFVISGIFGSSDTFFTLKAGTYTFSKKVQVLERFIMRIGRDTIAEVTSENGQLTLGNDTNVGCAFIRVFRDAVYNNVKMYPQIESGSSATSYEPYKNICPISGYDEIDLNGCGVNIWDEETLDGYYNSNGVYDQASGQLCTKNMIKIQPNTSYYYHVSTTGNNVCYYDKDGNFLERVSNITPNSVFITRSDAYYMNISFGANYGSTYNHDISINYPSTDTSYHAYTSSNNLSIDLPSTVYGGVLDLESGILTVTHNRIAITSDISISKNSDGWNVYHPSYYFSISPKGITDNSNITCISNIMVGVTRAQIQNTNLIYACSVAGGSNEIDFTSDLDNTTDVKQFLINNNAEFVYKLATPTTIQLTPHQLALFKEQNNINSNVTSISVTYKKGILTVIEPATESSDGIMSAGDKQKLDSIADDATKTESSTTNGNIKIDGTETQVYDDSEIKGELSTDTKTIEGNPLNFTTISAQHAKSTILSVEPIQDLHGYDYPWVGGAGKNKLNTETVIVSPITFTENSDGSISASPNNSDTRTWSYEKSQYKMTLSAGSYNLIVETLQTTSSVAQGITIYDSNNTELKQDLTALTSLGKHITSFTLNADTNIGIMIKQYNAVFRLAISDNTVSDWTPYKNECPISGRTEIGILGCGKNFITNYQANKSIDGSGQINTDNNTCLSNNISVLPNTTYALSWTKTSDAVVAHCFDENNNYLQYVRLGIVSPQIISTNNLPVRTENIYIQWNKTNEGNVLPTNGQFEISNHATTYEPYAQSNDVVIDFGQTVYGGTLDVENGVLVVDRGIGGVNNTWTYSTYGGKNYITKEFNDIYVDQQQSSHFPISSMCEFDRYGGAAYFVDGKMYQNNKDLYIQDSNYTTKESFISAYSDCQIVYYLDTPITINLTPHTINLLKGVNNISTDGDKITLTYRDGSVATLGDLTSAVDNLDSKIDESKILTDTVTGDKYILVVTNGVLSVEQISN